MGVLAQRVSLEIIPISLLAVYTGLFGFYVLAITYSKSKAITAPVASESAVQ
jgi:TctA family transporter